MLFIASFLDIFSIDGASSGASIPSAWSSGPLLLSVVLAGIIGAGAGRRLHGLPQVPKIVGLDLGQFGVAFTVFAAWSALGNVFDPMGGVDNVGSASDAGVSAGTGLILAFIATLIMAAWRHRHPARPGPAGALVPAPKPAAPKPDGAQPPGGYGYPGAQQPGQAFGGQPQQGRRSAWSAQPAAAGADPATAAARR